LAAIADMKRDPEYISGKMTTGKNLLDTFLLVKPLSNNNKS
jgi:hypothetical protein